MSWILGLGPPPRSRTQEAANRIVRACIDWVKDTGECLMCGYREGVASHDSDCPVGEYLAARRRVR